MDIRRGCILGSMATVVPSHGDVAETVEGVMTDDTLMRTVPEAVLSDMMSAAWDMAEEFEAELDDRYRSRDEQPVQQRRYDRDMEAVRRFRAAYEKLVF